MTATNDTLEKIQKLLEKAKSTNSQAEAEAFFAKASELMTRYGIQEHHLSGRSNKKKEAHIFKKQNIEKTWRSERPNHIHVRRIIAHCFTVQVIRSRDVHGHVTYTMLGTEADCAFAAYAFDILSETFRKLFAAYAKERGTGLDDSKVREGYFIGLYQGFIKAWDDAQAKEIKAQNADSYALVLVDKAQELQNWITSNMKVTYKKVKRSSDGSAFAAGLRDSHKVKIQRVIG